MTLKAYHHKRNFDETSEPKGKTRKASKGAHLHYYIQKHAASHLHYDLRLELNGVLLSWAVPKGPCLDPSVKRLAVHVEDHPLEYGTFEGTIPKGQYGGGTVMLWDKGLWIPNEENVLKAYQKGDLKFRIQGKRLHGEWKLIRIKNDDKMWLLIKAKDEYTVKLDKSDITATDVRSIDSDRNMEDIAQNQVSLPISPFPKKILPELATLVEKPPEGDKWLHEIKLDGYRIIAFKQKGKTRLLTRNGLDWTQKFPSIAKTLSNLPFDNVVLDGEMVVLDEHNKSHFQALQNAIKEGNNTDFVYYTFDIMYKDKYSLTSLSLVERKKILKSLIDSEKGHIRYSDHIEGSGACIFSKLCELSLEGIISKDSTSLYTQGRTKAWLKTKCIKRQEFVIGGFTQPQKGRLHFGSLLIGTYNDKHELVYNGHVGTGFSAFMLAAITKKLKPYHQNENPFLSKPPKMKSVTWVKPQFVAEVEFAEWTKDNILRHPSFKGLRMDKKPSSIRKEIPLPTPSSFKMTHPERVTYKEDNITKQAVADYYDEIHQWILPFVTNRPLTLVRCPDNYEHSFYQKHLSGVKYKDLHAVNIEGKKGSSEGIYIKNKQGLLTLIQYGVLEIHTWGSLVKDIHKPDMLVFDIDPDPDLSWKKVIECAFEIRQMLSDLDLQSFVKTTGGKGLHVVVPIKPQHDWREIKVFCHTFVDFLVSQQPKKYVSKISKVSRKGKIFIDYLRNQYGATAVAPYSTRARIHAPVATPLEWDELTTRYKDTFFCFSTIRERLDHLKKDPWQDFFNIKQKLELPK